MQINNHEGISAQMPHKSAAKTKLQPQPFTAVCIKHKIYGNIYNYVYIE